MTTETRTAAAGPSRTAPVADPLEQKTLHIFVSRALQKILREASLTHTCPLAASVPPRLQGRALSPAPLWRRAPTRLAHALGATDEGPASCTLSGAKKVHRAAQGLHRSDRCAAARAASRSATAHQEGPHGANPACASAQHRFPPLAAEELKAGDDAMDAEASSEIGRKHFEEAFARVEDVLAAYRAI